MNFSVDKEKIKKAIKVATAENSRYQRAAKPYIDSLRILSQRENYSTVVLS